MSARSFLITGASGFVGHHLARLLIERGDRVVGLDRPGAGALPEGVESLFLDLQDPHAVASLPRAWDGVFHLAGASIPSLFSTTAPVLLNLEITLNLLEQLRDSKVLLVSSCHVYGPAEKLQQEDDPILPQGRYGLSKHLVEQLASHYRGRLDLRVARPFNHLGTGLRPELMVPSLLRRLAAIPQQETTPVLMAGWNSTRDFIDVRDVVSAYLAILGLDTPVHTTFNVCTGKASSIQTVVQAVLDLLGHSREIQFQGRPNSADDIPFLVGDPSRLQAATEWMPRVTLTDSLKTMLGSIHS